MKVRSNIRRNKLFYFIHHGLTIALNKLVGGCRQEETKKHKLLNASKYV